MRILRERCWLAVLALAVGAAKAGNVTFTSGFVGTFGNETEAIVSNQDAQEPGFGFQLHDLTIQQVKDFKVFKLVAHPAPDLLLLSWKRHGSVQADVATATRGQSSQSAPPPAVHDSLTPRKLSNTDWRRQTDSGSLGPGGGGGQEEDGGEELKVHMDATSKEGFVKFVNMSDIAYGAPLAIQVLWDTGNIYSRVFTLFPPGTAEDAVKSLTHGFRGNLSDTNPARKGVQGTSSTISNSGDGKDGTNKNTSGDSDNSDDSSKGDSSKGGSSGGLSSGGLSSGAVIGIAVACGVIGLAIIFGLVWWFVRRRKQQKELLPMTSAFSSGRRTDDLMSQKEASAETDAGPHSPYSDEGAPGTTTTTAHGAGEAAALAAGAASSTHPSHPHDQSRSFTPYSDRPSGTGPPGTSAAAGTPSVRAASLAHTTEGTATSVPSPTPGRATPRALSTPYAHLVEEGMTEDEIRRLEDEERQLDAAIEQAGRRPSAV